MLPNAAAQELFDDAQFDLWNQVLKPVGRLQSLGRLDRGAPAVEPELIEPLYEVALELRDRLRYRYKGILCPLPSFGTWIAEIETKCTQRWSLPGPHCPDLQHPHCLHVAMLR